MNFQVNYKCRNFLVNSNQIYNFDRLNYSTCKLPTRHSILPIIGIGHREERKYMETYSYLILNFLNFETKFFINKHNTSASLLVQGGSNNKRQIDKKIRFILMIQIMNSKYLKQQIPTYSRLIPAYLRIYCSVQLYTLKSNTRVYRPIEKTENTTHIYRYK